MIEGGPQPRCLKAGEHLRLLRSLASEVERAMRAIAANRLGEFEESIAIQQELSSRLNQVAGEFRKSAPDSALPQSDSISAELKLEIRAAAAELHNLNLRYSHLLQHASRSAAQMVSLFNSFKGQLKEVPGDRSKVQTWSCQV